jgi:hypothetical protein
MEYALYLNNGHGGQVNENVDWNTFFRKVPQNITS